MKTSTQNFAALLVLMLTPLAVAAQNFSADSVTHTTSGKTYRGKLFRAGNMVRAETFAPSPGAEAVILIVDLEKQVSYTIINRQKMIMVAHGQSELNKVGLTVPAGMDPCAPNPESPSKQFSCKEVSEEIVNGRNTKKLEVTDTLNGHARTRYVWFDPKLRTVLKVEAEPSTVELRNIQEGPQPASLFTIPTGYRQMEMEAH